MQCTSMDGIVLGAEIYFRSTSWLQMYTNKDMNINKSSTSTCLRQRITAFCSVKVLKEVVFVQTEGHVLNVDTNE